MDYITFPTMNLFDIMSQKIISLVFENMNKIRIRGINAP